MSDHRSLLIPVAVGASSDELPCKSSNAGTPKGVALSAKLV